MLEQSPAQHIHHGHGHQTFYHQQAIPEQTNKIQLTLILPNGVPSMINVDANTPMMDLLVQAASLNKLNPSGYSLVVLDSDQHVIQFKPNQTVGQIVKNCHLPQINGSSTISLLPKETSHSNTLTKVKAQPFEITVRLQVNLPDAQKILLRIDPTLPLHEIKEQICKQKKYTNSNHYTLRLPNKLDEPLLLGLSLAEYKTNELTLIYNTQLEYEPSLNPNQHQSFDRLYRTRSESQPPRESFQQIQNDQQFTNSKQIYQLNPSRPSHTSLHAYWNDPNFDTQSQISTNSSITKKRRAPRPPGQTSPTSGDPQIVYTHRQQQQQVPTHSPLPLLRADHHQSRDSLQSENTKKKRKAPVVAVGTNVVQKKDENDKTEQQQQQNNIIRPEPPPPPPTPTISSSFDHVNGDDHTAIDEPRKSDLINHSTDDQHVSPTELPAMANLVITVTSPETTKNDIYSSPPIASPEQVPIESPTFVTPMTPHEEKQEIEHVENSLPETIQPVVEPIQMDTITIRPSLLKNSIPKPPRLNTPKEKKTTSFDGLVRIINDHIERAHDYQNNEKQEKEKEKETNENKSYFRVARSRYGKFETDSQGFVNNSIAIFDSTNQQRKESSTNKNSYSSEISTNTAQSKPLTNISQPQTKGKQAYNLLKKYEQEEGLPSTFHSNHLKTTNGRDKSPTPIQLEVTERMTHISVTVESDCKQFMTRSSSLSKPPSPPPAPPMVAPKPSGKLLTEYRTSRGIGNGIEMTTPITDHPERASSRTRNEKHVDNDNRLRKNSAASYDALMESIRQFGGSQNLGKK